MCRKNRQKNILKIFLKNWKKCLKIYIKIKGNFYCRIIRDKISNKNFLNKTEFFQTNNLCKTFNNLDLKTNKINAGLVARNFLTNKTPRVCKVPPLKGCKVQPLKACKVPPPKVCKAHLECRLICNNTIGFNEGPKGE